MNSGLGRRIVTAALLTGLLVSGYGCSRSETQLDVDQARELYALSPVPPQFDVAREFLDTQIAPRRAIWSSEQVDAATRVVHERLAAADVSGRILDRLAAQTTPHFVDEVLTWLRSPEVRQVHAAAAVTTNAEAAADFPRFMQDSERPEPSEERLALVERYDRAAHCSRYTLDSLRLAIYGAGVMSDALESQDERIGADALRQFAQEKSELLTPAFEELTAVTLQFAFRGRSDAEVAAFVERSESEPMQWYYRTLSKAFLETLEEISNDLGNDLVTALESQPDA